MFEGGITGQGNWVMSGNRKFKKDVVARGIIHALYMYVDISFNVCRYMSTYIYNVCMQIYIESIDTYLYVIESVYGYIHTHIYIQL